MSDAGSAFGAAWRRARSRTHTPARSSAAALIAVGAVVASGATGAFATSTFSGSAHAPQAAVQAQPAHHAAAPAAQQPRAGHAAVLVVPAAPGDPTPQPAGPGRPGAPGSPTSPKDPNFSVSVDGGPGMSQTASIIVLMTVLSVAPAILLLMTSFTKIVVVLGLMRQAMGTPTIPPNQVIAGLGLFLSLFVMGPVVTQSYDNGIAPLMSQNSKITQSQAIHRAYEPFQDFMLQHTGKTELATMIKLSRQEPPKEKKDTSFTTLVPAFVLSELKTAFIIGFVVFIPFLIIDLVVASILMSMGMMMLPPVMISLPFKLLLFIMVDGWSLVTTALVTSYNVTGG